MSSVSPAPEPLCTGPGCNARTCLQESFEDLTKLLLLMLKVSSLVRCVLTACDSISFHLPSKICEMLLLMYKLPAGAAFGG